MAVQKRVLILNEAELKAFYGNPCLTTNDQRYFFALNDKERKAANQFRARRQRCMFVVLLRVSWSTDSLGSPSGP